MTEQPHKNARVARIVRRTLMLTVLAVIIWSAVAALYSTAVALRDGTVADPMTGEVWSAPPLAEE